MTARRATGGVLALAGATALGGLVTWLASGRHRSIGASSEEVLERLPGDDLVPGATVVATRGISIDAPIDHVWPWIAQLGQQKGGFYSYSWLENLAGCDIANARRIVSQWQNPQPEEPFHLHPELALQVAEVEPGHALVVRNPPGADGPPGTDGFDFSWAFVVRPDHTAKSTRLLVRERYLPGSTAATVAIQAVGVVSTVMTVGMLRGVRARAETLFAAGL